MPAATPKHALPYPVGGDNNNIPADIQALATALDGLIVAYAQGLEGGLVAAKLGRLLRATDTGKVYLDLGASLERLARFSDIPAAQDLSGYLAKSGGTMTGDINMALNRITKPALNGYYETASVSAAATGAWPLDWQGDTYLDLTPSGNITSWTESNNPPANRAAAVTVIIRMGATLRSIAWPAGTVWMNTGGSSSAPVLAINQTTVVQLVKTGGSILGFLAGQA